MSKRILHVGMAVAGLALILTFTPLGAAAQQGIRNVTLITAGGSTLSMGSGTNGTAVLRVNEATDSTLSSDTTAIRAAVEASSSSLDNIETNLSQDAVAGNDALSSGPQLLLQLDDTSPTTVSEGQARQVRGSSKGDVYMYIRDAAGNERGANVNASGQLSVVEASAATALTALQLIDDDQTGGTPSAVASAASTNATNVKASAGRVLGFYVVNTTATVYYLRMYNLASAPTCSSATGYLFSLPIPASTSGAGFSIPIPQGGIAFGTGIAYCLTGGASSTDNTNAATGIFGAIVYK